MKSQDDQATVHRLRRKKADDPLLQVRFGLTEERNRPVGSLIS